MNATSETTDDQPPGEDPGASVDEGPGCLPAFLAIGALLLMFMFVACGFGAWYIYQQRTELAVRTLEGYVIPELEQSGLEPDERGQAIASIRGVIEQAREGKLEDWQASGIMERLNRMPLLEWGDLETVEALIANSDQFTAAEKTEAIKQFSRLRRAAELEEVTAVDFAGDVLDGVYGDTDASGRARINRQATTEQLRQAVTEAQRVADRVGVPDQLFDVSLNELLDKQIELGKSEGGF